MKNSYTPEHRIMCLVCGDNCCLHLMENRKLMLTPSMTRVIRLLFRPDLRTYKDIAHELGLTVGTVKMYMSKIYSRLGWIGGSDREVLLWALAHREKLGIELPDLARPV